MSKTNCVYIPCTIDRENSRSASVSELIAANDRQ